ncbi:hypothetical protein BLA29_009816, partial [Euroglyphus maynei]
NNNQWPISTNNKQHPARNVIFHNNKPTSLAINPSASNIYPDYHQYYLNNNNNNNNANFNPMNRLRFGPFGTYIDDDRFNEHLLNLMATSNMNNVNSGTSSNNKLLNPLYTSASDSHLNYYGPIIQATKPPLSPPPALTPTAATTIPLTASPSIINVNHLLGNTNFNYRLLEYWLLRNQMSKMPTLNANINHLNRLKINQDLLAAMQSKLLSPKLMATSASTTTPIELEHVYFQNGPGYSYGNFMKMPDKYKDAILTSKLLSPTFN